MKNSNNWCMKYGVYYNNGCRVAEHIIVTANSLEEALEKLEAYCNEMNNKYNDRECKPCDNHYQIIVGGGCKW